MSAEKGDLSRAGTMQATAKDGKAFLDKNLTDWKKPYLMDQFDEEEEGEQAEGSAPKAEASAPKGKKAKLAKHTTMKGTAKEANAMLEEVGRPDDDALTRGQQKKIEDINSEKPAPAKKGKMSKATTMVNTAKEASALLGSEKPDQDALTRGQQKKIAAISSEKPSAKKVRLSKAATMLATTKEAKTILAGEKLSDTRQETKKRKGAPKRASTIAKTMEEAKAVFGDLPSGEGRSLRKRAAPTPKPALKKAGTMQKTAKEGKEFLKKSKAKKTKKEENNASPEEEEKEEEEVASE